MEQESYFSKDLLKTVTIGGIVVLIIIGLFFYDKSSHILETTASNLLNALVG